MLARHQARRKAAFTKLVAAGLPRRTLMDPVFNLREIVKQMVLLEDHLTHPYKLCPDCVRKHLLTIEGFAEEAATLDQLGIFRELTEVLGTAARRWIENFEDGTPPPELALSVRAARKKLAPLCADPRGSANRVASLWLQRGLCPHRLAALG
ncbi:MAG: hypothetical protein A2Y38_02760 [Spirochaetes bacterium GWB1_59_5]|nr:MAG: hypothetical protein A2Y38_02760 [Spirochaetes bacterium GWB1_59_5]